MRILGLEGTAHTCSAGIVEDENEGCRVRANQVRMLRPKTGGIHPREAADHHVEQLPLVLRAALDEAGVRMRDLDGIAFSQGPGLGPCLRTVATTARALALRHGLPLLGVNHCVAHLEIGRGTTGAQDPVMLYASGANTQVIAEARGRYRIFGETLDIGIGNALDKFAREQGQPFPGGPEIEKLARDGERLLTERGGTLPELPYSVKGMDVAFAGFTTAAETLVRNGTPLPIVAHAFQEWGFAMLVEVTERALAHTGKTEVLLGGGVGRNLRLQAMVRTMAEARGASFYCPAPGLLSDNGAMIAWNGLLMLRADAATPLDASQVSQRYRTDDVPLVWRSSGHRAVREDRRTRDGIMAVGAEAEVQRVGFLGRRAVLKRRRTKSYRHADIERFLVASRLRHEGRLLADARKAGAAAPAVLDADPEQGALVMEEVDGVTLREAVESSVPGLPDVMRDLGDAVGRLHAAGVIHGDLTTSNVIVSPQHRPVLIDFGLGERTSELEARAVDLHVLQEALESTHAGAGPLWQAFLQGYRTTAPEVALVLVRLDELVARGRYRSMLG